MALTPEQISCRQQLVAMGDFNAHTLLPGEEWTRPENADVRHVSVADPPDGHPAG